MILKYMTRELILHIIPDNISVLSPTFGKYSCNTTPEDLSDEIKWKRKAQDLMFRLAPHTHLR